MTKEQFKAAAIAKGWKPDSYGHLKHTSSSGREYRLKLQKLSWRLEQKVRPEPSQYYTPPPSWVNRRSAYYGATTCDLAEHKANQTLRLVPSPPEPKQPPPAT